MKLKQFLKKIILKGAPRWVVLLVDIAVVLVSFVAAYIIRFNFTIDFDVERVLWQLPMIGVLAWLSFLIVGSYKGSVRYTGIRDITVLLVGVNILLTLMIVGTYPSRKLEFHQLFWIPLSIIYIHFLLNIFFLVGSRYMFKALYKEIKSEIQLPVNVLIYGAGDSGLVTYEAIHHDPKSEYKVIGFIDDDEHKQKKRIDTLKVHSLHEIHAQFIKKQEIDEVIISIQNIDAARLLEIVNAFYLQNVKTKIVPPVKQWIDGNLQVGQIKEVKVEDLLGREPIVIKNDQLLAEYDGKTILVTGAAGSIGSEISRKLSTYDYKHLVLLDQAESALYDIQQEFKRNGITDFTPIIADVRNKSRLAQVFEQFKPDVIFHAAAYKHVPLMENNPYEAVNVNVRGTKNVTDLAIKYRVKKFVMVSTDKAVNPTNVMGATKRIAELYVSCLKNTAQTKFVITRFGNVLGSNGSVIPLFKKQIANGGPLTVTHKDITRYFMTIPEACQLVLEAGAMGDGGEIYVFDMGKPVKIYDLALNMIFLSGLSFPEDVDIKITGLRPGEKIYEELLANDENTQPTYHEKIRIAKVSPIDIKTVMGKIVDLVNLDQECDGECIVSKVKDIVPEYISNNSTYEALDKKKPERAKITL